MKKNRYLGRFALTVLAAGFALAFLMPTVLTITNSFMTQSEISANYGKVFSNVSGSEGKTYISETVNLKFIPDKVSLSQYITVLIKSPDYLLKFWNSVILVVPIVLLQLGVASITAYGFTRWRGKVRSFLFFFYVILMLMPVQVTLVPNYLVRSSEWQVFKDICLPQCRSALYSIAILVFIDYWNMVEQPIILLPDAEKQPLSVYLSTINSSEVGLAFAIATIYMVPSLLLFLHGEDYLVEGIAHQGSVKG